MENKAFPQTAKEFVNENEFTIFVTEGTVGFTQKDGFSGLQQGFFNAKVISGYLTDKSLVEATKTLKSAMCKFELMLSQIFESKEIENVKIIENYEKYKGMMLQVVLDEFGSGGVVQINGVCAVTARFTLTQ